MATAAGHAPSLEEQIAEWRSYLRRRQAIHSVDVAELEDHLREQVEGLIDAGLAADEAFLVAVKRMGALDALSREFALEHSERLWKQLVIVPSDSGEARARGRTDAIVAFGLALTVAAVVKLWMHLGQDVGFFRRNVSFAVLPFLAGYFAWKRRLDAGALRWLAVALAAVAALANVHAFAPNGSTEQLTGLHVALALWLVVGVAYAGGRWRQVAGRMDFIRFSGELFLYYVLIYLSGAVLMGLLMGMFETIGIDLRPFLESWVMPCGAAAAVLIAAWLVEAKQSVIENMAPVLTRLFSPLFAAGLVGFLVTLLWTGRGVGVARNVLSAFDLLLVLVLALLVYSISAREPGAPPDHFDGMQVVLLVGALLADAVALWAIAARITEFGFSPNRVGVLGVNVILLVNLAWSAVLYVRFLRGRGSFAALERWQTDYLRVYAAWTAIVVVVFPPAFGHA
jgi:hypothetical protein